jgi:hypothetical protein
MKAPVLAATGGTGRLIVRFHSGKRPFRRGPGLVGGERRSAGRGQNRGRCSVEGALACSLVVKGAESPH